MINGDNKMNMKSDNVRIVRIILDLLFIFKENNRPWINNYTM